MTNMNIIWQFTKLAIPNLIQLGLLLVVPMINLYFIGLLKNEVMTAGVGLAMTFCNIMGYSIIIGTNSA